MALTAYTGFISLGIVIGLFCGSVLLIVWFHRRRSFQPIRSRFWWLSETTACFVLIWSIWLSVALEFPELSNEYLLYAWMFLMMATFSVLVRLVHIYSAYEVATVLAEANTTDSEEEIEAKLAKAGFFVRNAATVQRPLTQGIAMLVHAMVQVMIWGSGMVFSEDFTLEEETGAAGVILLCYVVPLAYFAWRIAALADGLYLKREMLALSCVGGVNTLVFGISRLLIDARFLNYAVSLYATPWPVVAILIAFPLYKSYLWEAEEKRYLAYSKVGYEFESTRKHSNSSHIHRDSSAVDLFLMSSNQFGVKGNRKTRDESNRKDTLPHMELAHILSQPAGRTAFITFCKLELNHETVLFFLDASKYLRDVRNKTEISQAEMFLKALQLYNTYVKAGAVLEVNLGHWARRDFLDAGVGKNQAASIEFNLNKASEAIRAARDEAYKLMIGGPYVRFQRHRLYREFIVQMVEP